MTARARSVLVVVSTSASLAGVVATVSLVSSVTERLPVIIAPLAFVAVAVLIVVRRPDNRIGWLLLFAATVLNVGLALEVYAIHAHGPDGSPGSAAAVWIAWVSTWLWAVPIFLLFGALPLLYPDGRLPSRRWRPVAWGVGVVAVASAVVPALRSGPMGSEEELAENPLGIAALAPYEATVQSVLDVVSPLVIIFVVAAVIARWRRSSGVERQQMKLFLAAVAVTTSAILVQIVVPVPEVVVWLVWLAVPTAIAVAILRYRLYDIDRIVSRTVSYAVLTVLLVGVYAAGVLGLGAVMRSVTGGGGGDLVVAASTLAVAAAFGPFRRRVQTGVDRRFNRARYDAARTVESFAQRLRDEVDIESAREALAATASVVIQPRYVGVWLRTDGEAMR